MSQGYKEPNLSIVVPMFNEAEGIEKFYTSLIDSLDKLDMSYEVIFVNDGSQDDSAEIIKRLSVGKHHIKLLTLSTNFGKENAMTAGICVALGRAILTIDADGQHPIELIPKFIELWKGGSKVVVGVRKSNYKAGASKLIGSKMFYTLVKLFGGQELIPGSTDFRLIDSDVQKAFMSMPERDRITRGLIDWLGFSRSYIYFSANPRLYGHPAYSRRKLFKLAASTFVSLSPKPLYLFSYLGGVITFLSALLGVALIIEQLILGDPLHWKFSGTAMLSILLVFLIGLILISQGIMSLYISHIHTQSMQRPLYVIDYVNSIGIDKKP